MKILQVPKSSTPHLTTVKDKVRNSGLTSVRWVNKNKCIAADFAAKKLRLIEIKNGYELIFETDTIIADGTAVETDLMDYRDGLVILTNFYQGSLSMYRLDGQKLVFLRELVFEKIARLHGVRFVPDHKDLVWVTFCDVNYKRHQVVNYQTGEIIHNLDLPEQAQDVAFINDKYAVIFARTNHITRGRVGIRFWKLFQKMYATAFVYQIPNNLYTSAPILISSWKGKGHIDAVKEFGELIYAANQYNSTVDVFALDGDSLRLVKVIDGFEMPHGLDIDSKGNMIVTNYADNTLRILQL